MRDKITFSNLMEQIADETGASRQKVHDLLKEMVAIIDEGLWRDGRVSISGLGIFGLKWRAARQGINPQTGESIEISAHNRVYFNPGAPLRRFINRKYEHIKPEIIDDYVKPSTSTAKSKDSFSWRKGRTLGWTAVLLVLLLLVFVRIFSEEKIERHAVPQLEANSTDNLIEDGLRERKKQRYPVPQPDPLVESASPVAKITKSEAKYTLYQSLIFWSPRRATLTVNTTSGRVIAFGQFQSFFTQVHICGPISSGSISM